MGSPVPFVEVALSFPALFIAVIFLFALQIYVIDSADRKRFEETGQVNNSSFEIFPKSLGIH